MPPNYNPLKTTDDIELLAPEEHREVPKRRHARSESTSSFIHFKAPQQREENNRLASQVKF